MEIEYRKATAGTKVECRICGKKFYPEKLRVHRKYFCGESAQRTAAQSKTEKKRARPGSNSSSKKKTFEDASDEEEYSEEQESEDDIVKTKQMNKASTPAGKQKSGSSNKAKAGSSSKKKHFEESGEESEDEIAVQKRKIKEKAAASSKGSATKKTPLKKKFDSDSDDDVVDKKPKATGSKNSVVKASKAKKITPKKRKASAESDEDADYFDESASSDESDDSEDASDFGSSKKKATPKGKASQKSFAAKKKAVGKGKNNDVDEDEVLADGDDVDEEVERDIREALKAYEKQIKKNVPKSILHLISWFRIILDEAHLIKDRSTSTSKSVFNLISMHKWCLTGTPLQNRVGELYSLVRFLRIDPFAYYYCRSKACQCKSLHYRFTNSKCDDCGHSVIQHYCHFNKYILNPIHRSGYVAEGRKAMFTLKNQVLDEILLRRTKINRADDIQLPMRVVRVRQEKLDEKEDDFYQALYTQVSYCHYYHAFL